MTNRLDYPCSGDDDEEEDERAVGEGEEVSALQQRLAVEQEKVALLKADLMGMDENYQQREAHFRAR